MRIAAFDDAKIGVVANDDTVVDVTDLLQPYEPLGPEDLLPDLITHFDDLRPELERRAAAGKGKPLDEVRLRSPLTRPSKIICLMGNYREGTDRPLQILDLFFKSPEEISGPGDTVVLPPHQANIFHHEGEIAVVIGREAKDLSADERWTRSSVTSPTTIFPPADWGAPASTASSASHSIRSPRSAPGSSPKMRSLTRNR